MKKSKSNGHSSSRKLAKSKSERKLNHSPHSRARKAQNKYTQSDGKHNITTIEVATEALIITLQFFDDELAYRNFCDRRFFENLRNKPGKKIDFDNISNVVCKYVYNATNLRRKKVAYKLGRIVECLRLDGVQPGEVKAFIDEKKGIRRAYEYAIEKYPRPGGDVKEDGVKTIDNKDQTGAETKVDDQHGDTDVAREKAPKATSGLGEREQAPHRKKPNWPKSERSINLQTTSDAEWLGPMRLANYEEMDVRIGRRSYDGEYVDLVIVKILSGRKIDGSDCE